jgi:hypothetical protein
MPSPALRLVPRKRLSPDQAQRVKASLGRTLAACPDERALVEPALHREIDRVTAGAVPDWEFVMVSPEYLSLAIEWAATKSPRPKEAIRILGLIWRHIDRRTGAITLSNGEIAAQLGIAPGNVGRCLKAMSAAGFLNRMEVGRSVIYGLSPWVATSLSPGDRAAAREALPRPRLVSFNNQAGDQAESTFREDPRQLPLGVV